MTHRTPATAAATTSRGRGGGSRRTRARLAGSRSPPRSSKRRLRPARGSICGERAPETPEALRCANRVSGGDCCRGSAGGSLREERRRKHRVLGRRRRADRPRVRERLDLLGTRGRVGRAGRRLLRTPRLLLTPDPVRQARHWPLRPRCWDSRPRDQDGRHPHGDGRRRIRAGGDHGRLGGRAHDTPLRRDVPRTNRRGHRVRLRRLIRPDGGLSVGELARAVDQGRARDVLERGDPRVAGREAGGRGSERRRQRRRSGGGGGS